MDLYQVLFGRSTTPFASSRARCGESLSLSVAGPLDDDLVAGVGQAVQGAVTQDGIIEEAEPFLHGLVAGDDEAGDPRNRAEKPWLGRGISAVKPA